MDSITNSMEGLMLKLKFQYFGHLMRRADSFGKTQMLGKIEGRRRRGWQDEVVGWHHQLNEHEWTSTSRSWWRTGSPGVLWFMGSQRVEHDWVTEWNRSLSNITRNFLDPFSSVCLKHCCIKSSPSSCLTWKTNLNQKLWIPFHFSNDKKLSQFFFLNTILITAPFGQ